MSGKPVPVLTACNGWAVVWSCVLLALLMAFSILVVAYPPFGTFVTEWDGSPVDALVMPGPAIQLQAAVAT